MATMLRSMETVIVVFAAVVMLGAMMRASAQSTTGCTTAIVSLSPCLAFITGNNTTPSSSCCTQLGNVVQQEPQCLCSVLNGAVASNLGITINQTQALLLPGACNVQTPSASRCNTGAAPAESPAQDSPATDSPPTTSSPSGPTIPSGTGSKSTPNADNNTSAAVVAGSSYSSILLVLAAYSVMAFNSL